MIIDIRKSFKGGAYKSLLWVIIVALAIGYIAPGIMQRSKSGGGTWAFKVNGDEIGVREYMFAVEEQRSHLAAIRAMYGEYADLLLSSMGMIDPKALAFRLLVTEELITQVARKLDIHLHAEYVAEMLNDPTFLSYELAGYIPDYVRSKDGSINESVLRTHLQRKGISIGLFEQKVDNILNRKFVTDLVAVSSYVPSFEIQQAYVAQKVGRKFSILTLSLDGFIKKEKQKEVAPEDLKRFFDRQNSDLQRYIVPEKRTGIVWKFSPEAYGVSVSDDEGLAYYEAHKSDAQYLDKPAQVQVRTIVFKVDDITTKDAVRARAEKVRSDLLVSPNNFAQVAKESSDDTKTRGDGGLLPWLTKGDKKQNQAVERAAFLLKDKGDISELIDTGTGFELVQLVDKKQKSYKPYASVKKEIKAELAQKNFKDRFAKDAKEAIDQYEQGNKDAINNFATTKSGQKSSLSNVEHAEDKMVDLLFKTKPQGSGFYTKDSTGYLVVVTDVAKSHVPLLKDVKDAVLQDYYAFMAANELKKTLENSRNRAKTVSLDELKNEIGGVVETTGFITSNDTKELEVLRKKGISPELLLLLEKVGSVVIESTEAGGVLIKLDQIEPINQEKAAKEHSEVADTLVNERMRLLTEGFVASLHRNATIETNESVFFSQE